jgi:thiol-disulfide isomerase/thioredoxin
MRRRFFAYVCVLSAALLAALAAPVPLTAQQEQKPATGEAASAAPKPPSPEEELRQAIEDSRGDSAALVRNLESFLKKYPDTRRKADIYRALVEANLQLRDSAAAAAYAEHAIALSPNDVSMTLLTVQLLDRAGDAAGFKRATSYATRVLEYLQRQSPAEKSPRVSLEQWENERKSIRTTVLTLRGKLYRKQNDFKNAAADFQASFDLIPSSASAENLGEITELQKDLNRAITLYARAFLLADPVSDPARRQVIRHNLGNVWRLAHGSEDGLGEFLLNAYDEMFAAAQTSPQGYNSTAHEPYDFTLRRISGGEPLALSSLRGKVVVMNFWATWCGPCRMLEPYFERVAAQFRANSAVLFLSVNCDVDEALVAPYLKEERIQTATVFADGLNRLLDVNAFPTVIVLDRSGKISYRVSGFGEDDFEKHLGDAVRAALGAEAHSN